MINHGKISSIVPVYNVANYLRKTLDSLLEQTYENMEIILIDDGSNDGSGEICDEYKNKSSKVKVIHKENGGVSSARNIALGVATGDFISFIDSDDYIERNMYEIMIGLMIQEQADVCTCKIQKNYTDGRCCEYPNIRSEKVIDGKTAIEKMNYEKGMNASFCNKIFTKHILEGLKFKEGIIIGEDYSGLINVFAKTKKVVMCPCVLYHYIQRNNSVSYMGFNEKSVDVLKNYRKIKQDIYFKYPELYESTLAYETLQEMAVVISMIKSKKYDFEIIRDVRREVRTVYLRYIKNTNVPLSLKICSTLMCIDGRVLIFVYKTFFRKRMRA